MSSPHHDKVDLAGAGELADSLERVIGMLNKTATVDDTTGGTGAEAERDPAETRSVGHAANGRVRAEVSAFGRLEALDIDPGLSRAGATAIADYVLAAVQAAQDEARERSSQLLASTGTLDAAEMSRRLGSVAVEATQGFDRMLAGLTAAIDRIDRR